VVRNIGALYRGRGAHHALKAGSLVAGVAAAGVGGALETLSARRTVRRPVLEATR
jgi:hypothetical protein